MIAYHYPPEGSSSGVLRTLKFSKYLPRYNWAPQVLTLRESFYSIRDDGLLRDVPSDVVVHRTRALDITRHLTVRGNHPSLFTIPDRLVGWLPFGVARGLRVVRRGGIRALYSTSPHPTAHLIAASLKAVTGLPWIADFRDPWIEEGLYPQPGSLRYRVESVLERAVTRKADLLTVTTPYLRGDFLSRYPDMPPEKVRVIYNGYDESDFVALDAPSKGERFEILHAGGVGLAFRNPAPLLEALASLIAARAIPRDRVRVAFLGGGGALHSQAFSQTVARLGLGEIVQILERVPHRQALRRLRQASCLLILQCTEDTRSLIPAKLFEYLRVGRPILALTPEGATADLLKGMAHSLVVHPSAGAGLQEAIALLYRQWRDSAAAIWVDRPLKQFERAGLAAELAQVLGEVAEGPGRG